MRPRLLLLLVGLLLIGCSAPKDTPPEGTRVRSGDDPVTAIDAGNKEIRAAIGKAQATLDEFIHELQNPRDDGYCSIKFPVPTPDGSREHMWLSNLKYTDGVFSGELDSTPYNVPSLKAGAKLTVKRAEVEDWMIFYKNGEQKGGFTSEVVKKMEKGGR